MSSAALLGFGLGALAATAAILILIPVRWQDLRSGGAVKLAAGAALVVPLLVLTLVPAGPPSAPADATLDAGMMAATPASGAPSASDWSLLSHMYLGGPPPGAGAGGDGAAAPAAARATRSAEELVLVTQREPDNAEAWLALAHARRQARDFPAAVQAYERALKLDAGSADAWADYADALASANGKRLAGPPATAIARALKLEPDHLKGLWLQASLDLEQRNYAAALAVWKKLRAALPPGSQDAGIIDANIAEAEKLAAAGRGG